MPLLLAEEYAELDDCGLAIEEDETKQFLVLKSFRLPEGLYDQQCCDVLVVIPNNYPQAGNDMFWTYPRLSRCDGKAIPQTNNPGTGDNRMHQDIEFCRWSRHWPNGPSAWKPGSDGVVTIIRRLEWAFRKPDANR